MMYLLKIIKVTPLHESRASTLCGRLGSGEGSYIFDFFFIPKFLTDPPHSFLSTLCQGSKQSSKISQVIIRICTSKR